MTEPEAEKHTRRWLRIDLLIALFALFISALSATVSVYQTRVNVEQTRVIANQLSASVWPYLNFIGTSSGDHFSFGIQNNGLGPAIVKDVVLTFDGRTLRHTSDVIKLLEVSRPKGSSASITYTQLSANQVVRPSQTSPWLDVQGGTLGRRLAVNVSRLRLHVCYCSLLDQCWTIVSIDGASEPHSIPSCPAPGPDELLPQPYS